MHGRSPALTFLIPLLSFAVLLIGPRVVQAHALEAEYRVLPNEKVQINSWYNTTRGDQPARGARVRVFRANRKPLEGTTDAEGTFVFRYDRIEPLKVEVYQTGHRTEVTIPAAALGKVADAASPTTTDPESPVEGAPASGLSGDHSRTREGLKEILVGVGFLLAVAAFVLSLWNSQRLRQLEQTTKANTTDEPRTNHGNIPS